jgi:hypothetical protein
VAVGRGFLYDTEDVVSADRVGLTPALVGLVNVVAHVVHQVMQGVASSTASALQAPVVSLGRLLVYSN